MTDPVERLARPDKWYLGAGEAIVFAPSFPVWLDAPGFWEQNGYHMHGDPWSEQRFGW
jgi:DMSO/TMAO reductase YedYZ molybdopterin-dependent catalytic subunit